MKRIVITGSTGFIGIHLINEWLCEPCLITAVIRPNSRNRERIPADEKIEILELEMDDYAKLPELVGTTDYFYHFAWEGARAPLRDDEEMQEKNYQCAVSAFKAAHEMGCTFFLGSGSQAEYGIVGSSCNEETGCFPHNAYGRQKLRTRYALEELAEQYGMRFIWTRVFSVYGRYDYQKSLISACIDKMRRSEPVELTECTQLWDYLHVGDVAKAMKLFAEQECPNGVYNLASGNIRPLKEYILEIKNALNSDSELLFGAVPYGKNGPVNLQPDISKIRSLLGWHAETSFEKGIQEMIS